MTRARMQARMERSEANVGVRNGSGNFGDLRCAGAARRAGGKRSTGSAEQTHERLSFRVVLSIPTPEPPVPPLAAQFFGSERPIQHLACFKETSGMIATSVKPDLYL